MTPEQLTLDDELLEDDGLSFDEWVRSLPVGPEEGGGRRFEGVCPRDNGHAKDWRKAVGVEWADG